LCQKALISGFIIAFSTFAGPVTSSLMSPTAPPPVWSVTDLTFAFLNLLVFAVVKFSRNGVLPHVPGVPPPENAVPPPKVVVPPPGNDVPSPLGGKSL